MASFYITELPNDIEQHLRLQPPPPNLMAGCLVSSGLYQCDLTQCNSARLLHRGYSSHPASAASHTRPPSRLSHNISVSLCEDRNFSSRLPEGNDEKSLADPTIAPRSLSTMC